MSAEENFDVELFIDAVKNYPEIWNLTSESYHDRVKKRNAWIAICEMFSEDFSEKDERERNEICNKIVKRWKNIKDSYMKNAKKKTKSGQGAACGRKYIYARQLSFLQESAATATTESSLQEDQEEGTHVQSEVGEGEPGPSTPSSHSEQVPKKRKAPKQNIEQCLVDFLKAPIQMPLPTEINPDRQFFESLLPAISSFTEDEKLEFRCAVLNTIKKNEVGQTKHPTNISISALSASTFSISTLGTSPNFVNPSSQYSTIPNIGILTIRFSNGAR